MRRWEAFPGSGLGSVVPPPDAGRADRVVVPLTVNFGASSAASFSAVWLHAVSVTSARPHRGKKTQGS